MYLLDEGVFIGVPFMYEVGYVFAWSFYLVNCFNEYSCVFLIGESSYHPCKRLVAHYNAFISSINTIFNHGVVPFCPQQVEDLTSSHVHVIIKPSEA